jgi:hypothetical protein
MNPWPFDQPPDCAVITLRQIIEDGAAILEVSHDADDHGWQFMTTGEPAEEDLLLVCFSHVVERDASLLELADLPPGWIATRAAAGGRWRRDPAPHAEDSGDGLP